MNLAWLHCNECHRSFEHHNRLSDERDALKVIRTDLTFSFTSCGHFFCENCLQQNTIGGKMICPLCQIETTSFKVDNNVPKTLEMYLKPPINQLEDSISVMTFQISNATHLIKSLRTKVAQQKELISKAKQELSNQKLLKEKLNELQQENDRLRKKLEDVTRAADTGTPKHLKNPMNPPQSPTIHNPGRLTLRSPLRFHSIDPNMREAPRVQNWTTTQRSPSLSEIYINREIPADAANYHTPLNYQNFHHRNNHNHSQDLAQPIYQTPLTGSQLRTVQVPTKVIPTSISQRSRTTLPPSPRPVPRIHHNFISNHDNYS